ncbi:MAG: exodeoxyribonuclease VII large subunit, partial [Mariprofundus sp.]
ELACPSRQDLRRQLPRIGALAGIVRQKMAEYSHRRDAMRHRQQHAWHRLTDSHHHQLQQLYSRLLHLQHNRLNSQRNSLISLQHRLTAMAPAQQLHNRRHSLSTTMNLLHQALHNSLQHRFKLLQTRQQHLHLAAGSLLPPRRQRLLPASLRLKQMLPVFIPACRQTLALCHGRLSAYDSENILSRGYSLNYDADDKLVTCVAALQSGSTLRVAFQDGSAHTRIESITRSTP